MKRIHFKDNGQDFLSWDINELGIVIACKPFQGFVWIGYEVIDHENIMAGDELLIQKNEEYMVLKHTVTSVENICPECGTANDIHAIECQNCGWEFGLSN